MAEYLKIPKDRIGALVGKGGKTKRALQKKCKVKLDISQDGGVKILSQDEDALKEWVAKDVVKAIGRGFNPKYAFGLLRENRALSVLRLYDMVGHNKSDLKRVKSRIIGENGRARKTLETLTKTKISVYGKTVAIIGPEESVREAEDGIRMLIDGARHATVYAALEGEQEFKENKEK